jgi:hypothetical protein
MAVIASSPVSVYAFAGNGAGSSADPYEITNCAQLQAIKDNLSASYELMNSIDCAAQTGFMPISGSSSFTGTFDGNNYTIDNLTIDPAGSPDNVSLFGQLDGATIRNFTLNHVHITGGDAVGSVAGLASGTAISGVKLLNGVIQGVNKVGGFVGVLNKLDSGNFLPALEFSWSKNTTVQGVSNTTTTSEIGGAAGEANSVIKYVSTEGSVAGNTFDNSMSDYVGGIAGKASGVILSYSRATVLGGTRIGGIAGYTFGNIINSYSSGNVTGTSYVGGIVGETQTGVYNTFSDSIVIGDFPSGSIIGDINIYASFVSLTGGLRYDSVRSTQAYDVGYDERFMMPNDDNGDVAGQANYFFNNDSTTPFDFWDFVNDWQVQTNDYPLLRVQPSEPTTVSVTPGLTSLKVSWGAPEGAQQAPITGYRLEYVKAGKTAMAVIPITDPTVHSYTITGLNAFTDYNLRLRAINQAGAGDIVSFTSTTLSSGLPTPVAPTNSGSGKLVSTAQSQFMPPSFQYAQPIESTDDENAVANEPSNQTSPTVTNTPQKTTNSTVSFSDANAQKESPSSAWWWLSVPPIVAAIWFWRKHKTVRA